MHIVTVGKYRTLTYTDTNAKVCVCIFDSLVFSQMNSFLCDDTDRIFMGYLYNGNAVF